MAFETTSGIEKLVIAALAHAGYKIAAESRSLTAGGACCEICYQLRWYDDGRAALTLVSPTVWRANAVSIASNGRRPASINARQPPQSISC